MDSIFMRRLSTNAGETFGVGEIFPPNGKATSLREEFDYLKNGFWQLRCILLDSTDMPTMQNNEFIMDPENKVLHELLLLLDLAAYDFTSFDQINKEYRQKYVTLR